MCFSITHQSEDRNGCTEVPGCEDGTGLSQAPLVVHDRAWPSNQGSSGMYSFVYCKKRQLRSSANIIADVIGYLVGYLGWAKCLEWLIILWRLNM